MPHGAHIYKTIVQYAGMLPSLLTYFLCQKSVCRMYLYTAFDVKQI